MSETEVKKHLRAAHRADPETFDALIREYIEKGPDVFKAPRPGENAGSKEIYNDTVRSLFLAQVMLKRESAASEAAILRDMVDRCAFWGTPDPDDNDKYKHYGTHEYFNSLKSLLNRTKQKYKNEPAFAEKVDMHYRLLKMLGA